MPLAIATAVNFTAPLFATIAAVFVLHEDVRLRRWSAIVIGFAGVLVIMRPGSERLDLNLLILLLSAASAAVNNITVKFLARTEPPGRIVAMFMLPDAVIPGAGAVCRELAGPVDPGRTRWARNSRALSVVRALAAGDASACAPFEFARLPFAALVGFLWFGEVTDVWTWVGAGSSPDLRSTSPIARPGWPG